MDALQHTKQSYKINGQVVVFLESPHSHLISLKQKQTVGVGMSVYQ